MTKYIFVTGGVVSGLGKGITASSIGVILKSSNLKVFMQKFDPYLNIDPGTMSPYQHGEVFVTADGAETDLDLGHYERFIDEHLTSESNITAGLIYKNVISKERSGEYEGKTIQVIPHVTNEIKAKVYQASEISNADIVITEIGGTVGDIESLPFIEAIRQVRLEKGRENVLFIHVALVPYLSFSKESKTKPIQHSVKELLSLGVQPDVIVARTEVGLEEGLLQKIALFCNIEPSNVFVAENVKSIYEAPLMLNDQNISLSIKKHFNIDLAKPNMKAWEVFVKKIKTSQKEIEVTIVGKYIELPDAYLSVIESLNIAGYENNVIVKIKWIKAEELNEANYHSILSSSKAILVPGGFGERGIEGKILAAKYARENQIPYLGICLGMQVACIEIARNLCNLKNANSSEFKDNLKDPVIDILHGKNKDDDLGGTLRLGNFQTNLLKNSLAYQLYQKDEIIERHRHRYEFNNIYRDLFEKQGVIFSGIYKEKNLVEIIELENHPFFIASQYHPEFTSRPNKPNPLFNGFVKAIKKS